MSHFLSRCVATLAICAVCFSPLFAQDDPVPGKSKPLSEKKAVKPFKVLTSGKRITIQSTDNTKKFKQILVWTSGGNRIVEQHELDAPSFDFSVSGIRENVFFLMVAFKDGERFSEKIGVR